MGRTLIYAVHAIPRSRLVTLLKIEIDDAVRKEAAALPDLPVFRGGGGLRSGIDPCSNKSMLAAADDQQGDATKRLREQATADLMLAIEGATLATPAPWPAQDGAHRKSLREELYDDDFRAGGSEANSLG